MHIKEKAVQCKSGSWLFLKQPFFVELTKGPPAKTGADWKRKKDIGLGSPTKVLGGECVCDKRYFGGLE
jgi:hypothetical protein